MNNVDREFTIMVFYRSLMDDPEFLIVQKPLKYLLTKILDNTYYPLLRNISLAKFLDVMKDVATSKPESLEVLIDGLAKDTDQRVIHEVYRIVRDAQEKAKNK